MILPRAKLTESTIILIHVKCNLPNQNKSNNFLYLLKYTLNKIFYQLTFLPAPKGKANILVWP